MTDAQRIEALELELKGAREFKQWVHWFLDSREVPHDPAPEETARHGSRIHGRMTYVFDRLNQLELELSRTQGMVRKLKGQLERVK